LEKPIKGLTKSAHVDKVRRFERHKKGKLKKGKKRLRTEER